MAPPAPVLAQFERFVAQGRVSRATVTTRPLTHSRVLLWVVDRCRSLGNFLEPVPPHTDTVYQCRPQDAR
jgi:hypothetical protein